MSFLEGAFRVITDKKKSALALRLQELELLQQDIRESFIIGSGRGGQKKQKTASAVQLKHVPSGIVVKCDQSRSREDNRFFALRRLCDLYEGQVLEKKSPSAVNNEKKAKQKKRRKRRAKKTSDNE